jgi:hypothetical protein
MIAAVPAVRPRDAAAWVHYLTGLWAPRPAAPQDSGLGGVFVEDA